MTTINEGPVSMTELIARIRARQEKPDIKSRPITAWQELAIEISRYLVGGMSQRHKGSIFKACKDDSHAARIAYEDMKEMGSKPRADGKYVQPLYFFKVYNVIKNNYDKQNRLLLPYAKMRPNNCTISQNVK